MSLSGRRHYRLFGLFYLAWEIEQTADTAQIFHAFEARDWSPAAETGSSQPRTNPYIAGDESSGANRSSYGQ